MKKLFLLLSLCCMSLAAWAQENYTDENGVTWSYYLNESYWDEVSQTTVQGASITRCTGYGADIVVPEFIAVGDSSYKVLNITEAPFSGESGNRDIITSITLPSSLRYLNGWSVFSNLTSLRSINIPESITYISGYTFSGCTNLILTLPESVSSIGEYAFQNCNTVRLQSTDPAFLGSNIAAYHVFDGVKHIAVPDEAYEAYKTSTIWSSYSDVICTLDETTEYTHTDENGITWTYCYVSSTSSVRIIRAEGYTTTIDVPAALPYNEQQLPVTAIECSFQSDDNIVSVDLSKTSITTTPSFLNCTTLSTVLLPATLKSISEYAFYYCSNLQTVDFSQTTALESISQYAFQDCDKLQTVDLSATKVKTIEQQAFCSCERLDTIVFPATLETIGRYAFSSCSQLNSVDLSNTKLTVLDEGVFGGCYRLSFVSLPSSLKKIGTGVFAYSWNSLVINLSEVEEIGEQAFYGTSVYNADLSSVKSIGSNAFYSDATFTINATTPATIKANSFTENSKFIVTPDAYDAFCSAPIWSNWAANISMYNVDADGVKWIYRYLKESNSMCITSASGYGKTVTVPSTVSYNGVNVPVTQIEQAFSGADITSVTLPTTLTCIGNSAFAYSKLTTIDIPSSVTTIGNSAFYECDMLTSIEFPNTLSTLGGNVFCGCDKLNEIDLSNTVITEIPNRAFYCCQNLEDIALPTTLTQIKEYAFNGCYKLKQIDLPQSLKTIERCAFQSCYALNDIDLSKVETIGDYAFGGAHQLNVVDLSSAISVGCGAFTVGDGGGDPFFTINNTVPATIASGAFPTNSMFLVPGSAVAAYKSANVWSDYASTIFASNIAVQTVNVTAQTNGSGVLEAIGGSANQTNIIDLTVKGTINGYDFVMFKDKMLNLRFLDLSEAKIVYNPYCYYEYNYSQNDTLGAYAFNQENKLISIKLPKDVKYIGNNAFEGCSSLKEVVFGDKVERIGYSAFSGCSSLSGITLPNSITSIDSHAFSGAGLKEIILPNKLGYIGENAFSSTPIKEIAFPTTLTNIGWGAFQSCWQLETVRIPSSLQYVGDYAFQSCQNLKNVYTYTIEPTDINENTFSNFETAMLYVPVASGQNYYWDEGWKRFVNVAEFDEEYVYFYLNGDHTLDESTGAVDGTPEADLNPGSGLIVEEEVEQNMSDLNIHHNGTNGGSIIAGSPEGNINADSLHVHINVQSGRWYFFCFPFDLKKENISFGNEGTLYVFRCYDGSKRAEGNSGWKNVTEENGKFLKAATGYIFQCSQSDVLTISLADVKFKKEDKYNELVAHAAANMQDASWNFVGNPYLSYYDMAAIGYDAPITVWNGYTYEAIKPGDDDYQLAPFEAFFVQKPENTASMEFSGEEQTTYRGSQVKAEAARARRRAQAINPERLLVNITLSNGQETDRTRIVFNDKVSMGYELECDAAKFEATGVPQIYTIDSRAVKYAINERPVAEGIVTLGYSVPTQGNYTLAAPRMDTPIYIKDNLTGTVHNFAEGSYEFATEAGTFDDRFTVIMKAGETGIDNSEFSIQNSEIYNTQGQRVENAQERGVYIKDNRKVVKF